MTKLDISFPTELCLQLYILFSYRAWEWIKMARTCIWLGHVKAANKWCLYTHIHTMGWTTSKFLELYVHCWTKMQFYPTLHCLYVTLLCLWAFLEP